MVPLGLEQGKHRLPEALACSPTTDRISDSVRAFTREPYRGHRQYVVAPAKSTPIARTQQATDAVRSRFRLRRMIGGSNGPVSRFKRSDQYPETPEVRWDTIGENHQTSVGDNRFQR